MKAFSFLRDSLAAYRRETGFSLIFWAVMAALNFAVQIVFRRHLMPGEFAMLNSLLAVIALTTVPVFALQQAFAHFQAGPERLSVLQAGRTPTVQNFTLAWAFIATPLLFLLLALLGFPRVSFDFFALLNMLFALGALVGTSLCEQENRLRSWARLIFGYAVARLFLALFLIPVAPWTESGLTVGLLAGFITLSPLLRQTDIDFGWKKMWDVLEDREFRLYFGATLSVTLGIFLFTNADRIVAQAWFGRPENNNVEYVNWGLFDGYQTAGLLGRSLLWGTQPFLLVLLVRRMRVTRTTWAALPPLWIYLGVLAVGAFALSMLAHPLSRLFGGTHAGATAYFIPAFAGVMIPMGLLQAVGIFSLASRRYPECFILGASSLVYTLVLFMEGRPQLMLSEICGGGLMALMLVLFVGVVRWGRKQP